MLDELQSAYPGSTQVRLVGMDQADDLSVWRYARDQGFAIVTKDSDFHELSLIHGNPPKVIWLKCGNKPRWFILGLLLQHQEQIRRFLEDPQRRCVEIG